MSNLSTPPDMNRPRRTFKEVLAAALLKAPAHRAFNLPVCVEHGDGYSILRDSAGRVVAQFSSENRVEQADVAAHAINRIDKAERHERLCFSMMRQRFSR